MELETQKAYIKTHIKTGFIWPSKLSTVAPVFFDKKPYGSLQLYVDYWGLNNLTIKNWYLLTLIGELLDWLDRVKRFIHLDFTSAYQQIRIRKNDEWKMAFRIRYSYFKYQIMPFGFSNTPASFQGYINKILAEKLNIFEIVYLDNIQVYTKDPDQPYMEAICWVLNQI